MIYLSPKQKLKSVMLSSLLLYDFIKPILKLIKRFLLKMSNNNRKWNGGGGGGGR